MNANEFNKLVKTNATAAVVDVWAPWCSPCKRMNPLFEELKQQYEGRVELIKVNADESQPLVKQLGVLGIPTTIVYRNGEEIGRRTGAMSRSDLVRMFEAALSDEPVKIPAMSRKARLVRLFITGVLIAMGFSFSPSWLFFIFAAIVLFLGVYDLIPGVTGFRDRMIQKLLRAAAEADVDVRE
jgi:thioredoxin